MEKIFEDKLFCFFFFQKNLPLLNDPHILKIALKNLRKTEIVSD